VIYHVDPWAKMQFGWLAPRVQAMPTQGAAKLQSQRWTGKAGLPNKRPLLLYHPARGAKEFFLLEYRTRQGEGSYDTNVSDEGLAIWHILHDKNRWVYQVKADRGPHQVHSLFSRGAPAWSMGGTTLWKKSHGAIALKWYDGKPTGTVVHVGEPSADKQTLPISWCKN
jgi:hypothetical protein